MVRSPHPSSKMEELLDAHDPLESFEDMKKVRAYRHNMLWTVAFCFLVNFLPEVSLRYRFHNGS